MKFRENTRTQNQNTSITISYIRLTNNQEKCVGKRKSNLDGGNRVLNYWNFEGSHENEVGIIKTNLCV